MKTSNKHVDKKILIRKIVNVFAVFIITMTVILMAIGILSKIGTIEISRQLLSALLIYYFFLLDVDIIGLIFYKVNRKI